VDLQSVVAEITKIVTRAAGFTASHAAQAAVDGLPCEAVAGTADFGDDLPASELGRAGSASQPINRLENGVSAARAVASQPRPKRRDRHGGSINRVAVVRIV